MTDIMHFAKLYRGVVSDEICAKTVSEMDTLEFKEHTFYNAKTDEHKPRSGSQELSMSWGNVSTKQTLNDIVDNTAYEYVKELNMPWFDKYQGYSHVRFNKYAENKMMALHADHIHSMFDGERKGVPILSVDSRASFLFSTSMAAIFVIGGFEMSSKAVTLMVFKPS